MYDLGHDGKSIMRLGTNRNLLKAAADFCMRQYGQTRARLPDASLLKPPHVDQMTIISIAVVPTSDQRSATSDQRREQPASH